MQEGSLNELLRLHVRLPGGNKVLTHFGQAATAAQGRQLTGGRTGEGGPGPHKWFDLYAGTELEMWRASQVQPVAISINLEIGTNITSLQPWTS